MDRVLLVELHMLEPSCVEHIAQAGHEIRSSHMLKDRFFSKLLGFFLKFEKEIKIQNQSTLNPIIII